MFRSFPARLYLAFIVVTADVVACFLVLPQFGLSDNLTLAVALVTALAFSALFTFLNYRIQIAPIKKINDAAKNSAKGNLDVKITGKFLDKDIKELSESINEMNAAFENLEQFRKQFVSNASHELRSPLTSIQGFLQAILDGTVSPQDRIKYLNIVFNETKRLSTLVNSMLDLSRMEAGKVTIVMSRFELNALIRRVVDKFEQDLVRKHITLDVNFISEQCYVFADKDKIEQVLINLIDNAIKYSPEDTKILVTTHFHAKKVYVSVKDKGIGISKKDINLIWERFYMSDRSRTPVVGKGTGLGLAIVKKIVEDHKEVIWAESVKGVGSTFVFTLSLFDPSKHRAEIGRS